MQNQIPKNWQKFKLGDVLMIRRGASPRPIHEYIVKQGIPWLKISDVTGAESRYVNSTKEFIKQEGVSKSVVVKPGALILSNSATPGIPRFMRITACVHDGWLILEPTGDLINKDFLYYRLVLDRSKLVSNVTGAVFDNLNTDVLRDHEVFLPSPKEQEKIANILTSFNDKIELNNEIVKTLEDISQTLFKEWFVKNKPSNWEISNFEDIANLEYGKALQEEKRISGDVLVFGSSGQVGTHNEKLCAGPGIVVGRKGNVGSVFWVDEDFYPIDTTFYVNSKVSLYYMYFILKNMKFHTGDSAVPGLNRESVHNSEILIPDNNMLNKFDEGVIPMFKKLAQIKKENQKLAALRDLLLPKLMSGEVRV